MSVILEFTVPGRDFTLGEVLSESPEMYMELERIVPTGEMMLPFVWATGEAHDAFAEAVRSHPAVDALEVLDSIGDSGLYRIEWAERPTNLIEGIVETGAVVLEARGDDDWHFKLRFTNHDRLSGFHNFVIDQKIPIHIERTYTLSESTDRGYRFDLSPEQREAIVLALRRGYFDTPSKVELDELAAELDITRQAVSDRIRRGNQKVLRRVLLSSVHDLRE